MKNSWIALLAGIVIGVGGLYFMLPYDPMAMRDRAASAPVSAAGEGEVDRTAAGDTLHKIKQRGYLHCGVSQGLPGFSNPDERGNWKGIDVDFCRALAAAVFNDASRVRFRPLSAKDRFTALQSGEIDILSRNTTWTMSRDKGVRHHLQHGACGRDRLHGNGHDDRTQSRRLFPWPGAQLQGAFLREKR